MNFLICNLRRLLVALMLILPVLGHAESSVGIILMHGKNPGGPGWQGMQDLTGRLGQADIQVLQPEMPWSRKRYIDVDFDTAMREIDAHIKTLRAKGAQHIVLAGHSMGCPAAMAFAARHGGVDALVLLAPGHTPLSYYNNQRFPAVRASIDQARQLVVNGEGDKPDQSFADSNQGKQLRVVTTARTYLSYFDPDSDAEMSITAPRIPGKTPILWVIGKRDPLYAAGRAYVFDKLSANPRSRYLEVDADHITTPSVAAEQVTAWIAEAFAP